MQGKRRMGIRNKTALMTFLSISVVASIGVILGYFFGFHLLRRTISEDYLKIAYLLNESMNRIIEEEISDLEIYMSNSLRVKSVKECNMKYAGMEKEAIGDYFGEMDEKWPGISESDPLADEYLNNRSSNRLKMIVKKDMGIGEVFMTDKFGGLVASSGKTSDFYQADEEWWQEAFHNGEGKVFIGNIEFDESSNQLSLPMAVPIRDVSGRVIGVCKSLLNVKRFFAPLESFKFGSTGHAVLVDENNYILSHHGIKPMTTHFIDKRDFHALPKKGNKWAIITCPHIHKGPFFVAYEDINHPLLLKRGMRWKIFIVQDTKEAFAPLNELMLQFATVVLSLMIVSVFSGFIFGGIFTIPIKRLHAGIERLGRGEFGYKMDVKTNDEIEDLAEAFNEMTGKLKNSTTSISVLNKEIAERRRIEGVLRENMNELERFNKVAVGRELKMRELKKKIRDLEEKQKRRDKGMA